MRAIDLHTAGAQVVGRRIALYWMGEEQWFEGEISDFNIDNGQHRVRYDDGDHMWYCLSREKSLGWCKLC